MVKLSPFLPPPSPPPTHTLQCEDNLVPHIVHSLRKCIETALPTAPKDIKLKRFVAQSYIGLFLEEDAASWFRELMKNFAAETKRQGGQGGGRERGRERERERERGRE